MAKELEKKELNENEKLVLVTGASGFIAGHIIKQLAEEGYNVRGTVRSLKNAKENYKYLYDISPNIELFEADLSKDDDNWDKALNNVSFVVHTANPMIDRNDNTKNSNDDDLFIKPALSGMKIIMDRCLKNKKTIKRFVYTSSVAACVDRDNPFDKKYNISLLSTKMWTDIETNKSAYAKSKAIAEKYAWDFIKENNNPFELVVINPGFTLGPLLHGGKSLGSTELIKVFMSGDFPLLPNIQVDMVDVRDVALAHVNALNLNNKKIIGNRYLLVNQSLWAKDITTILKYYIATQNKLKNTNDCYPITTKVAPNIFYKIVGYFDPAVNTVVTHNLNKVQLVDNQDTIRDLHVVFKRADITIQDCAQSLIDNGFVKKQSQAKRVVKKVVKISLVVGVIGATGYWLNKAGLLTRFIKIK